MGLLYGYNSHNFNQSRILTKPRPLWYLSAVTQISRTSAKAHRKGGPMTDPNGAGFAEWWHAAACRWTEGKRHHALCVGQKMALWCVPNLQNDGFIVLHRAGGCWQLCYNTRAKTKVCLWNSSVEKTLWRARGTWTSRSRWLSELEWMEPRWWWSSNWELAPHGYHTLYHKLLLQVQWWLPWPCPTLPGHVLLHSFPVQWWQSEYNVGSRKAKFQKLNKQATNILSYRSCYRTGNTKHSNQEARYIRNCFSKVLPYVNNWLWQ